MEGVILNIKLKRKEKSTQKRTKQSQEVNHLNIAYLAAKAVEEKKGENIVLLDVSKLTVLSDYFLVVTANSSPQIEAIANHLEEFLSKYDYKLISKEGVVPSNWTVLDFGNLIVHIMRQEERDYYKLERFWCNAVHVDEKQWEKAS